MLPALIGAGASLGGGILNMLGGQSQADGQVKFAKNAIQWKVADAKKAGIHPLAALGASTSSYTPISSGFGDAVSQAGAHVADGVRRSGDKAEQAGMNQLNADLVRSNINTNQAQADLYKAQALNEAARARNAAIGAVGGLSPVPATQITVGGKPLPLDESTSDAESWEQRYGDIAQEIGGMVNVYRDYIQPKMRMSVNRKSKADLEKESFLRWLIPQITYKKD